MKHRFLGIYGKVFLYTLLILIFVIGVTGLFFANQITAVIEISERQHLNRIFEPLYKDLSDKTPMEIAEYAQEFHTKNSSFEFCLQSRTGEIIYVTDDFVFPSPARVPRNPASRISGTSEPLSNQLQIAMVLPGGTTLYISGLSSGRGIYNDFIRKMLLVLLVLFLLSTFAAALFARRIAVPIKKIALNTRRMSDLEFVPPPVARRDEIGQLAADVYKMYESLKTVIDQLETEIEKGKEMEENQRYFFFAASHELKTPVAAAGAILEGIIEGIIDPCEYSHYLIECMKMMSEQKKLIAEILEIVRLGDKDTKSELELIDLGKIASGILPAFRSIAYPHNIEIEAELSDVPLCYADTRMFTKALSNVMMNAVQNTAKGERVKIFADSIENNTLCLNVVNTGAYIEPYLLGKLFVPFFHDDKSRSRESGKNGLGLTIVKGALDKMNIPFSIENTPQGVAFKMYLKTELD